jgi:hypothetical protein
VYVKEEDSPTLSIVVERRANTPLPCCPLGTAMCPRLPMADTVVKLPEPAAAPHLIGVLIKVYFFLIIGR